jgi:hypothetical protein
VKLALISIINTTEPILKKTALTLYFQTTSTMTDPQPSPLCITPLTALPLAPHKTPIPPPSSFSPPSLRNAIYTHALTSPTKAYTFTHSPINDELHGTLQDSSANPHRLALLRTCRQIHAEAHVLPFTLNGFHFAPFSVFERTVVRLLPFQRAAITRISVTTTLGSAVDALLDRMRRDGYACARDVLPNVGSVEIRFCRRESLPAGFWYAMGGGVIQEQSDKRRLVAWFNGGAGDVEVLVQEVR